MSEQAAPAEQVITNKEKKSLDPRIAFCIMIVMICIALCIGARKAWIEKRIVVDTAYAEWQENIEQRLQQKAAQMASKPLLPASSLSKTQIHSSAICRVILL